MMDIQRREQLQRVINDSASTHEERTEAKRQLEETDAQTQADQDKLIIRYLNHQIEPDEMYALPASAFDVCHALIYWILGLDLDLMDNFVKHLVALYGRTQHPDIRCRCIEAIKGWQALARRYNQTPQAPDAARHATRFLNSLKEQQ